ncbi:hypothetical protein AVEN_175134-1 [Araneus ventricosus]|uniref:Uncharacterized protein n=1 Tax=Araneus ventricosus TaxID=182803 RepID=A0A4Y2FKR5_ARAVE|nr:hypothetical protein AVEN_175134-1 [Araneus ventricosus]
MRSTFYVISRHLSRLRTWFLGTGYDGIPSCTHHVCACAEPFLSKLASRASDRCRVHSIRCMGSKKYDRYQLLVRPEVDLFSRWVGHVWYQTNRLDTSCRLTLLPKPWPR